MVDLKKPPEKSTTSTSNQDNQSNGSMLMRSTGLGKAELVAGIVSLRRQGGYLIMELQTTQPVRWKIRCAISHKDIRILIKTILRNKSVVAFILNPFKWFKEPAHPGDF